jgi:hypothetical protein
MLLQNQLPPTVVETGGFNNYIRRLGKVERAQGVGDEKI